MTKLSTYSEHRPTGFDRAGAFLPDRQDWFVVPVSQTRDSGPLDQSNFQVALDWLGGESETVEVHRFGHWGPGWYEIIIIKPGSKAEVIAKDIDASLADYPVLDEMHYSELEYNLACETWHAASISERMDYCERYDVSKFAARRNEIPECNTGELIGYLAGSY